MVYFRGLRRQYIMDKYIFNGKDYIAPEGYQFINKTNGYTSVIMRLSPTDNIENYTIELIPIESDEEKILEGKIEEELQ